MRRLPFSPGLARVVMTGVLLLAAAGAGLTASGDRPRVVAVHPRRVEQTVACWIETDGLPGERSLNSMQGGLPAAVDLVVDLLDDQDQLVQRREVAFRLAFDLWEEVFRLDGPGLERRFGSADSLRAALRQLGPVALVPIDRLGSGRRFRLRVGILEQVIAPSQRARVGRILAGGDDEAHREEPEHEVSFGLGRLIEFFYGRSVEDPAPRAVGLSAWFTREEIPDGSP